MKKLCLCEHDRTAHLHHRYGSECALCPDGRCASYRADTHVGRVIESLVGGIRRPLLSRDPVQSGYERVA
jgi:hypothetical protein